MDEYVVQLNPNCKTHYLCLESGTQVEETNGMQLNWVTDGTSGEGYFCQQEDCHRKLAEKAEWRKGPAQQCCYCGREFWECFCYYGMWKDDRHAARLVESHTTSGVNGIKTVCESQERVKSDGFLCDGSGVGVHEIKRGEHEEERRDSGRVLQELDAASEKGTSTEGNCQ